MQFLIADTFTDSLARLTEDERKAAKLTAMDLQLDPTRPGFNFHRIDKSKDKNFWSLRVGQDIRLIVHKLADHMLLCFVGHHDAAYAWAERRRLETHPATGAAQLVEIHETVEEVVIPRYIEVPTPKPVQAPLFAEYEDERLLSLGVPANWIDEVKRATEDSLLALSDHLPAEASEALLELATGGNPHVQPAAEGAGVDAGHVTAGALQHPDAQRRFRVIQNVEELEAALDAPWDKWTVFLHPAQRELVERNFNGPARVSGSAGTGKTVVAVHRAVFLARENPDARVLLTTFSEPLANILRLMLRRLTTGEPSLGERIDIEAMDAAAHRLHERHFGKVLVATNEDVNDAVQSASHLLEGARFSPTFLRTEWDQVVDAWQLRDWESYRDQARPGRRTRLTETQRKMLWRAFERIRDHLGERNVVTLASLYTGLAARLLEKTAKPYEYAVVDEAQDISVPQLRFLSAIAGDRPNGLFFSGDLGQRIFRQPFSWKSLGVDVRGRSRTLRVNYRTSHQIRSQADRLLDPEMSDVDDNIEDRRGTVSVFNGPPPEVLVLSSPAEEAAYVGTWLSGLAGEGTQPHEMAVFARSERELQRAKDAVAAAGLASAVLDEKLSIQPGRVSVATMHLAKGLEFRAVAVVACDEDVIPSIERIESVGDEAELEDVYHTERQLLYVACTRARERLLISSSGETSEFLEDLLGSRAD